ncbi:MAG TPA: radical SAM protein [Methylovirgula sp.]|nr:radical SAM protein [Methylovirgula sp.]
MTEITTTFRARLVDFVDRLVPKKLLRLFVHPKFQEFVGLERIEALGSWIDNTFMLKRRQKICREQHVDQSTEDYLKSHFCANPFRQLETTPTGLAYVCCPIWLPTPIGTLDSDPEQLWNSDAAKRIRESILDGSFRYCNHWHCPAIASRSLPHRDSPEARQVIEQYKKNPARLPEHLVLSHDKSCNLSCPSCRSSLYLANSRKQAELDRLTERTLLPLLAEAKSVMITGSGDPFGSKHFRNLIKRLNGGGFPQLRLELITNGQLLDERAWRELNLEGRVKYVQISIDATEAATYAIVRRGGDFARLRKNLAFLGELRRAGRIAALEFSMVVQALNFRQMPDFVRLGQEFAADRVAFNMIRQRDIFSKEEHVAAFIGDPSHPDYQEFLEVLKAPELARQEAPEVLIGNVLEYVKRAEIAAA